jgi:hypothetical protein
VRGIQAVVTALLLAQAGQAAAGDTSTPPTAAPAAASQSAPAPAQSPTPPATTETPAVAPADDTAAESPAQPATADEPAEPAPADGAETNSPAPLLAEAAHPVRVALDLGGDSVWELVRVDVLLDGRRLRSDEPESEASAPRPVWSGVVAPGPHNLAALLFFRPRAPAGARIEVPTRAIRIEAEHRFGTRPIRPLVLLITPARPAPPSEPPAVHFAVADAP